MARNRKPEKVIGMAEYEYVLEMKNIGKEYYGNRVLKGISFQLKPGEIMSVIGENGAGKSTLMNVLFGMPVIHSTGGYEGSVLYEGKEVSIKSPYHAMELGIGMVHQEFMLLPDFTVTENIKLNRELTKSNPFSRVFGKKLETLDRKNMKQDARKALDQVGLGIDEWALVEGMPVGYMQFVEIAREIDKKDIKVIVFDEPTAVLTESESQRLLEVMKKIAGTGVGIIFISHKLDEVIQISDKIMVMRDGEHVTTLPGKSASAVRLAELMVGRGINADSIARYRDFSDGETLMSIRGLKVMMPGEMVKGIDLDIKKGEIIGFAGLAGYGKLGISNGILGTCRADGEVVYKGESLKLNDPLAVLKKHIAFVSEDRKGVGLILQDSIEDNIVNPSMQVHGHFLKRYGPFSQIDRKKISERAKKMIGELQIKCTGPKQAVGALSGGNQQKVCIAAALTLEPEMLFVSEPTRGIDIGAKKIVLDYLKKLNREDGVTIVVTSSELKELRSVCDKIVIITRGKIQGVLLPDAPDAEYGLMMSGACESSAGVSPADESSAGGSPADEIPAVETAGGERNE